MDEKKKRNRHVALIVLILLLGIANGKRLQDRSAHIKRYAEMPTAVAAETKAAENNGGGRRREYGSGAAGAGCGCGARH